jgi:hypothetical protein
MGAARSPPTVHRTARLALRYGLTASPPDRPSGNRRGSARLRLGAVSVENARMSGGAMIIVTAEPPSGRRDRGDAVRRVVESTVALESLHGNLERFVAALAGLVEAGAARGGEFELDEVGFSAEIGANGEFKLLGSGVGVSGSSAVTFTWRRARPPE